MLKINNYVDNVIEFYNQTPFFYDKNKLFWFWNKKKSKYELVDEIDLMKDFDDIIGFEGQTVTKTYKSNYLEAFKRVGRKHHPLPSKKKWIQFKDTAYDLKGHTHKVDFKYLFTNPIPWSLGASSETPIMDKLFTEWVGEQYKDTLYEVIAYSCYQDYPIQSLICLYGGGRNGKSSFQKVIERFFGLDNICSTELDRLLKNRFESFKLYKKLICMMGETNFGMLDKTSVLKSLTGGDIIGFEKKGKDPFDEYSYAKMLIASNSLPSSSDTSEGFYRRWIIINFPNEFPEGKDIIETIPEQEYSNLARKVTQILPKLLERGYFTNQGTIEQRRTNYIMASNPLPMFINDYCVVNHEDEDVYVSYSKLYTTYVIWLKKQKKRKITFREFKESLENEGFYIERTTKKVNEQYVSGRWIEGLKLKKNIQDYDTYARYAKNFTSIPINTTQYRNRVIKGISVTKNKLIEHFKANSGKNIHEDEIIRLFKDKDKIYLLLEDLAKEGEVMNVKPYEWRLVE